MLIRVPQQSERDVEAWEREARADPIVAASARHRRKVEQSIVALRDFAAAGPCYVGVSWGKDSVCVAAMACALGLRVPLVWVRVSPIENPHCVLVRDAFIARHPGADYYEIVSTYRGPIGEHVDGDPVWDAYASGYAEARKRFGARHMSGVRAAESAARRFRMGRHGESTAKTCAPIGWWSGADVFAYLHAHRLPVHPAYAMSLGGAVSRERLRVDVLAPVPGMRGEGFGRGEIEQRYYGWRLAELRALVGEPGR